MKRVLIIMAIICMAFSVNAQDKYAVLIATIGNMDNIPQQDRWNDGNTLADPNEFWNDTYMFWKMLQNKGFEKDNIFVLYGSSGMDCEENPCYIAPKSPDYPESIDVTYGPANRNTIIKLFNGLAGNDPTQIGVTPVVTENDYFFTWVFTEGGSLGINNSYIYLADGYVMQDTEFASLVNGVNANRKTIWMQSGKGGGFADNLSATNSVFVSASKWNENAYRADNLTTGGRFVVENDTCYNSINNLVSYHGEFDFHMYSVINGESPHGDISYDDTLYITADNNIKDRFISMQEAYAWTAHHDSRAETTFYDDLGNIGSNVCLEYPTLLYGCPVWNDTHRGIIGVSSDFTVFNGQTVTLTGISDVTLCNDATFTVEDGGTLIIDGQVTFHGTSDNSLIIKGNLVQNNGSELSFYDMKVEGYALHLSIDNARFYDTELIYMPQLSTIAATSSIGDLTVTNCTFDNPTKNVAIDVRNSLKYKLVGDTIKASNRHGIKLTRCGNTASSSFSGRVDRRVYGNDISGCEGTGLRMYASSGEVLMNQIHGNGRGVEFLNRCNIYQFMGNCSALDGDDTQHIYDNISYEVYLTSACDPLLTRYNLIEKTSVGTTPYVYYDGLIGFGEDPINPSDRGNIDVKLNAWGDYFYAPSHLYSNVSSVGFDYIPIWVMGREECDPNTSSAQALIMEADSLCEEEEYVAAKALYMQVAEEYPNTTSAEMALKALLPLEALIDDDYTALKSYYLTNTVISSNEALSHLATAMANRCDEVLGNYSDAIAWYENVITDPESSFVDSICAAIDLGNLYLAIEENGQKTIGKYIQYKPESIEDYILETERALALLPRTQNSDRSWPFTSYPFWIDSVTKQPDGYSMDDNGDVEISTPEGLAWLPSVVNGLNGCNPNDFSGHTIRLVDDINLDAVAKLRFTPIGTHEHPFNGIFDGGGHSIEGLYIGCNADGNDDEDPNFDFGLFGYICNATVKNVTLNSGVLTVNLMSVIPLLNDHYVGGVVGFADSLSVVDGCVNKMQMGINGDGTTLGGIVGMNRNSIVRNCAYIFGEDAMNICEKGGGIVYRNLSEGGYANAVVSNCFWYGYIVEMVGGGYALGGIVGLNETDEASLANGNNAMVWNCFAESISLIRARYGGIVAGRNLQGSHVDYSYGHIWFNPEQVGLFGSNEGEAVQCSEFQPTGSCTLNEPVQVGHKNVATMLEALNTWVEMQEEPCLYKTWEVNEDYGIPMFADGITMVDEPKNATEVLSVFPNPTNSIIYIQGIEIEEVQVFNTLGQNVMTLFDTNAINVDGLPQGMYLLHVVATDGTSHVARVAVSR